MDDKTKTIFDAKNGSKPVVQNPLNQPIPAGKSNPFLVQPDPVQQNSPQSFTNPNLKLKQKLKPIEEAEKLAEYFDKLPPVAFSLYDNNPQNPYSLPETVGAVFVREGLLDDYGQVNFTNIAKLNEKQYIEKLKLKIIFCMVENYIKNSIFLNLTQIFNDSQYLPLNLESKWTAISEIVADHYAVKAAVVFIAEMYPDKILNTKVMSRLPLKYANNQIEKTIKKSIQNDEAKIEDTINYFLQVQKSLNNKIKKSLLENAKTQILKSVPQACEYQYYLDLIINQNKFPLIDINYYYDYIA